MQMMMPDFKKNFSFKKKLFLTAVACSLLVSGNALAQSQGAQPVYSGSNQSAGSTSASMGNPQVAAQIQAAMNQAQAQSMSQANAASRNNRSTAPQQPAAAVQPTPAPTMTKSELDELLKDKDSPAYKANKLADDAKKNFGMFGVPKKENETQTVTEDIVTPATLESLQQVHASNGSSYAVSDDLISKELSLDMRRDSQREAALSYGARGGLAKKAYMLMEKVTDFEPVLDKVFDFRQLLVKAPSGLLIEPPIVNEALDALVIEQGGNEAAVADQVLKINKQAKIVSAPRDWRQYLTFAEYATEIQPPPRVLWPKNKEEQADWNTWIRQGWEAGYAQGDDIFEANLAKMVADYNGMVRYRVLLAENKISQPFAMQEDRGVTGGKNEMRVGDRALRITGPSQFLTGANLWKPADR